MGSHRHWESQRLPWADVYFRKLPLATSRRGGKFEAGTPPFPLQAVGMVMADMTKA